MVRVTFACDCPHGNVEAVVERATERQEEARLLFEQSGWKSLELPQGTYDIAYRAQGAPLTLFSLTVANGGKMRDVERILPREGHAAGVRRLVVIADDGP